MSTLTKHSPQEVLKQSRRNFLKLALFGGGAFLVGKIFGSVVESFNDPVLNTKEFQNFKFTETKKNLTVSESGVGGEPLLIIEKDSL